MENKGLGIIKIQVRNIGPVKEVVAELVPGINIFQGDNGAGKSTVLNAVKMAFEGKKSIPANIIRNGLDENGLAFKGEVVVNTPTITVSLELKKDEKGEQKHKLVVKRDGAGLMAPVTFLENLATVWNDPQEIATMKGKDLYNILVKYSQIDLTQFDKEIESVKTRQIVLRAQKKEMGVLPAAPKAEKISLEEILTEIKEITDYNDIQKNNAELLCRYEKELSDTDDKINALKKDLEYLERKKALIAEDKSNAPIPLSLKDVEAAKEKLNTLEKQNQAADKYKQFVEWEKRVAKIDEDFENNKQKISDLEEEKKKAVETAEMPVEGLSITEEKTVNYLGSTWENCCESDRLLVGAKLIVNTTPENAIRWMMIHSGEGILSRRRDVLNQYLIENGYTCLMQVASEATPESTPGVFHIVEGEIK